MRKLLLALLILLFPASLYAQTEAELKAYTYFFASASRGEGSKHMKTSQEYIRWHCESWGYKTELQKVGNCYNVLAWKEGREPGVVVIGAHLDSYANRPGADDNASGSAAVLGMAHRFARTRPKYTLCFQWYTAEERGMVGSKFYANNPKWPIKQHIFMLNFDMVGRLHYTRRDADVPKVDVNAIIRALASDFPFAKSITYQSGRRSDQISFSDKGIPVVWLFTGTHSDYHRSTDTPDKINYDGMIKVCNYAWAILEKVVPTRPRYIIRGLPELPKEH